MKKACMAMTSFGIVLLLMIGCVSAVFADSGSITFHGFDSGFAFRAGSDFTETDLFGSLKNVMPGDTVSDTITFTNAASDYGSVNLYLRAEAHHEIKNPLSEKVAETETVATTEEFLSQLSMKIWNGTELICDDSPDTLDGLAENLYLGTIRAGESAMLRVELSVPVELNNRFGSRIGEVDWIFHVEADDSGRPETTANISRLIQTGQLNWLVWTLGAAGVVLVFIGGCMLVKKKRKHNG